MQNISAAGNPILVIFIPAAILFPPWPVVIVVFTLMAFTFETDKSIKQKSIYIVYATTTLLIVRALTIWLDDIRERNTALI
jgi:hypothetical protein